MKKFAVIGNPIQHSLSPLLHNSIFEQLGINASYEKVKLLPSDVESFVTNNEFDGTTHSSRCDRRISCLATIWTNFPTTKCEILKI